MTQPPPPPSPQDVYAHAMKMLGPALERVATDPEYRKRLELTPLAALAEMNVELDEETRRDLEGRRFSEFWAMRQRAAEGPVQVRDLPPTEGEVSDEQLESVAGGFSLADRPELNVFRRPGTGTVSFAPPYVPVGPVLPGD